MAHNKKIPKTNVGRILDQKKIAYELHQIPFHDKHMDAVTVAHDLNVPPDEIYKTLVTKGDKTGIVVACIPGNEALDLKQLAKASHNKKIEMLPMKDLETTTGYIRGGCSPIGMKKLFPTFIADQAMSQDSILISAGKRGFQVGINPYDLAKIVSASFVSISNKDAHHSRI
ncbi:ybaK / prolyl-tRNA synthetases associated domain-containing protein [Listeria grandensis FSL F6-0971]|uniref:Cys-tRNA(Pro)/Cys-tRNA(Cys) deacylase n=1 Tax=Listeria grandensis FSL F6-0971 TaxID=1265819 RepID=W7BIU8_9LIST|nr:Cys-tRNA(Pro) deacylase [Listeria grandensis]EUJ24700.1 ybaK / prolyl-tRNA synthetases associated domain-containing protein [Listeria grandensis FSL F6-0971]